VADIPLLAAELAEPAGTDAGAGPVPLAGGAAGLAELAGVLAGAAGLAAGPAGPAPARAEGCGRRNLCSRDGCAAWPLDPAWRGGEPAAAPLAGS
jgi:hypothetical protein